LKDVFITNGYPEDLVKKTIKKSWEKETLRALVDDLNGDVKAAKEEKYFDVLHVPYVHGFSEGLQKKLKDLEIGLVPKKGRTLFDHLCQLKQKKEKDQMKNVVYAVKCQTCTTPYIGETSQHWSDRKYQHKNDIKNKKETNGFYQHLKNHKGHDIDWDDAQFLDHEKHWLGRKIKESVYINALNPIRDIKNLLNIEKGYKIDDCWSFFNDEIRKRISGKIT
jgi:hypothetical protein